MYKFYRVLSYGAIPFALLRVLYKARKLPKYRERIFERLGFLNFSPLKNSIWVHAVSVGEVNSVIPVIYELKKHLKDVPIVVTTTTPTGSELVIKHLREGIYHSYIPYDVPLFVKRFINHINPMGFIVVETEIWPTIFYELNKKGVPIFLINGRISPTSFKNYLKIRGLISSVLRRCKYILVQNEEYKKRFLNLGAKDESLIVTGNIKFDVPINSELVAKGKSIKQEVFNDKKVIVGASTHEGEDEILVSAYKRLKEEFDNLILILIPRHPERFLSVYELAKSHGLNVHRRSNSLYPKRKDIQVYVGDSMGEMMMYYAMGDIAVLGGSFVKVGGHNFLEPAFLGLPIISGPHVFNFQEIADMLVNIGGLKIAWDVEELIEIFKTLLLDEQKRMHMASCSRKFAEENKGALKRTLDIILSELRK